MNSVTEVVSIVHAYYVLLLLRPSGDYIMAQRHLNWFIVLHTKHAFMWLNVVLYWLFPYIVHSTYISIYSIALNCADHAASATFA